MCPRCSFDIEIVVTIDDDINQEIIKVGRQIILEMSVIRIEK